MKQKIIDFLLNNANPSIILRVKKEILKNISKQEEKELQKQILEEKIIKLIEEKQLETGWIGLGFHGSNKNAGQYDNQEVGTKYMGEKGLKGTKILDRAMDAYAKTELEDMGSEFEIPTSGSNLIRCACIARAHYDDVIDIKPQIELSLESFKRVIEVDSIFDVSRPTKKCRLFNKNERWPCRYHLEILAFSTDTWRNDDNVFMLAESFKKLMRSDRKDIINTPVACWIKNHAVNPMWLLNEGYSISGTGLNCHDNDGIRKTNMEKAEWLCRCGLYDYLPELREEVDFVINSINEDGVYTGGIYEKEFKGWSPYFGAQLETDWKAKIRKQCDVTFRALLIGYYAGVL